MPTYTVHAPAGRLSHLQKSELAREITAIHNEHTGAQTFFAQVIFVDVQNGSWYVGGAPIQNEQIHLNGQVRSGRTKEVKQALLRSLAKVLSRISGFSSNRVWVYLNELSPSHMIEYGHILPEPGEETQWLASLPEQDRKLMESIGK